MKNKTNKKKYKFKLNLKMFSVNKTKRPRKRYGFANTKKYPHSNHPSFYLRKDKDDIEYVTFTHSNIVDIDGKQINTIPLTSNIDPKERGKRISYVFPEVYVWKRSSLYEEKKDYSLLEEDKKIVYYIFKNYPKKIVKNKKYKKKG